MTDPSIPAEERQRLVDLLMAARRDVGRALKSKDADAQKSARAEVDRLKRALGERGPVWWKDGAPDYNMRRAADTPYASWYQSLPPP